jgi:hypothetical protein
MSLSDPSSPAYGRHMTNEQVHRLIAPTPASLAAVEGFLRSHGLEPRRVSPNGDLIQITLSVQQVHGRSQQQALPRILTLPGMQPGTDVGLRRQAAALGIPAPPSPLGIIAWTVTSEYISDPGCLVPGHPALRPRAHPHTPVNH